MASPAESAPERKDELPRIPGYRIDGLLGRGATGVVYRATQLAVERPVALKILHPELVGTKRAVRRLQREARTAARLAHPSIISAIDMGSVGELWWYAMELVEGESLSERIAERGPLSEREALRLFSPLCDALQHAYEGGVVHRDIKPANILIDHHGRARLVDLGLAFAEDDPLLTQPGGTLGTPHFISPEQARDSSAADTRSDIWSLGASMYQALCGRPPFQGESVAEILSGVLYQRIPDPRQLAPHLSRGITLVLRKCLNRDPDARYQQPAELMRDLERLRERRAPAIRAGALDPVAREPALWRDPKVVVLGAAGVTLVAVAVVSGWFGSGAVEAPTRAREPESWPELEHVARGFERGKVRHHGALVELERMRVPAPFQVELSEARTVILEDLDRALATWRDAVDTDLGQRLERHDWPGAQALLAEGAARSLAAATGFPSLADLPAGRREAQQLWLAGLARNRDSLFEAARDAASEALARHYSDEVRERVRELGHARRWRDALDLVDASPLRWLEDVGADLRGFDGPTLARIEDSIAAQRNADRTNLRGDWLQLAGELMRWIEQTQETLRANLEGGDERQVGAKLREAFRQRLAQQGVERLQVPDAWDHRPFRYADRAAQDLEEREAGLVAAFARRSFENDVVLTAALCRRRDYAAALAHWKLRAEDPLFESLAVRLRLRVRECELLQGLLERAALEIERRRGQPLECYVGNILERGVVRPLVDPLRRGFELETRQRRIPVHFVAGPEGELPSGEVLLRAADIEALTGLAGTGLSPEERLLRALLRYYESDYSEALAALPIGSLADDGLVEDLEQRIRAAREAESAREQVREGDLAELLRTIKWSYERSQYALDPRRLQSDIDSVHQRFGDLLSEKDRGDLRGIQEALERSLTGPTIEGTFGPFAPGDFVRHGPLGVELIFNFDEGGVGTWQRGAWTRDEGGWSLPESMASDAAFLEASTAVRLELADPFDSSERVRLRLDLDPVWTAGLGNTLLVSIAGFHIVFLDDPASPRVLVDTTTEEDVLGRIRRGDVQGFGAFSGLSREQAFSIEVSVSPSVGKLDHIRVAGEELTARTHYKKPVDARPEIVLRSMQPVRLVSAQVEGRRKRQ